MKIVTNNQSAFGKRLVLPVVGAVDVSDEGVIDIPEVHDNVAEMLIEHSPNYSKLGGEEPKTEKSIEAGGKEDAGTISGGEDEDIELTEVTEKEVREALKEKLSLKDMKTVAAEAGVTKEDITKFSKNKTLMAKFLMTQLGTDAIKALL